MKEPFGKYTLLKLLGKGGMAEVFLAAARSTDGFEKLLAIKRLLPPYCRDDHIISMLADEARLSIWLNHPNIVQVLDFGREGKTHYIAMEYVEGCDLCDILRPRDGSPGQPLPLPTALCVVAQMAEALDYAHRRCNGDGVHLAIIHRDVSPHNVLISSEGQVKLADFGLARASVSTHYSTADVIRGKFSYMPKEQAHGGEIDHRIDIFATGATLYEALTGVKPYTSKTLAEQLYQLEQPLPPPSAHIPDIPESVDNLTMRAMHPDPAERYDDAGDLAEDLKEMLLEYSTFNQEADQLAAMVARTLGKVPRSPEPIPRMTISDFQITASSFLEEELEAVRRTVLPPTNPGDDPFRTVALDADAGEGPATSLPPATLKAIKAPTGSAGPVAQGEIVAPFIDDDPTVEDSEPPQHKVSVSPSLAASEAFYQGGGDPDSPPAWLSEADEVLNADILNVEVDDEAPTIMRSPEERLSAFNRALEEREQRKQHESRRQRQRLLGYLALGLGAALLFVLGAGVGWYINRGNTPAPRVAMAGPDATPLAPQPAPAVAPALDSGGATDAAGVAPDAAIADVAMIPDTQRPRVKKPPPRRRIPRKTGPARPRQPAPAADEESDIDLDELEDNEPPEVKDTPPQLGFLTVRTSSPARIYIDDSRSSLAAPLEKKPIPPGVHRVRAFFLHKKVFSDTQWVSIKSGQTFTVYFSSPAPAP